MTNALQVFDALIREVDAGRALVAMTEPGAQHRAAVDALALARDVLDDARELLAGTGSAAELEAGDLVRRPYPPLLVSRELVDHYPADLSARVQAAVYRDVDGGRR